MKRRIAFVVVLTVATWLSAQEPSKPRREPGGDPSPSPQRPAIPHRVPQPPRLPGREHLEPGLIDDRPQAREALKAQRPAEDDPPAEETDAAAWRAVAAAMGKPGEWKADVYRLVFPRDDLEVTVEGNLVPPGAGIESEFRFWRCPCGLINAMGAFVVADYEANDVIDALRKDPGVGLRVTSVGPLLLHEKPRLVRVGFYGENKSAAPLAKALREALAWTGKERMAPRKAD